MNELLDYLADDEILNKGFNAVALAQFLAEKGIIDLDEFHQYRDKYVKLFILDKFPELLQKEQ